MTRWSKVLTTRDDEATLDAAWQRVRARRARPAIVRRAKVVTPVAIFVAMLAFVVRSWLAPAGPATALAPGAPIALEGGSSLPAEWTASAPVVIPLDDGSRLELASQTVLKTEKGPANRVELTLESGRVTFDVKPNGPRAWRVDAGPVVVRVLGTRFTVARSGDAVEVTVERGKVHVTHTSGTRLLTAGESFATANRAARGARDAVDASTSAPLPSPAAPALLPSPAAPAPAPVPPHAASSRTTDPSPLPDPMARADALRGSGRSSEAVTLLRDVVDAGDRRAPLAAFTIGKVHAEDLGDPSGGARWFERAIALGLPSGLDEEAHARAVECFARAGARVDAARAARQYESRFPEGRHLARVKEWSRE